MRLRSIFALSPAGSNLDEALGSVSDGLLATVAHASVPVEEARHAALAAVTAAVAAGKFAFVTVNHPRTQFLRGDLEALVSPELRGVVINHCVEPQDVRDTAVLLREFELARDIEPGTIAIIPAIGTARGLVRCIEIVNAAPRVAALLFDSPAYTRDIGARIEERGTRLSYARGAIVAAARAFDCLPLVTADAFELRDLGHYGFSGAIVSDARAAVSAATAFATLELERRRAQSLIDAYDATKAERAWVARVDDEVADASAVRRARQLLDH